jgi:hypothetical protein
MPTNWTHNIPDLAYTGNQIDWLYNSIVRNDRAKGITINTMIIKTGGSDLHVIRRRYENLLLGLGDLAPESQLRAYPVCRYQAP